MQTMLEELLTANALPSGDGDSPSLCTVGSAAMPGVPLATVDAPDRLVREAAQGHASVVRDIIARHPQTVCFFSDSVLHFFEVS